MSGAKEKGFKITENFFELLPQEKAVLRGLYLFGLGPISSPNTFDAKLRANEVKFLGLTKSGRLLASFVYRANSPNSCTVFNVYGKPDKLFTKRHGISPATYLLAELHSRGFENIAHLGFSLQGEVWMKRLFSRGYFKGSLHSPQIAQKLSKLAKSRKRL